MQPNDASFLKEVISEGSLFTIDIQKLTQASANQQAAGRPGTINSRQPLQVLPRGLSPAIKTGILCRYGQKQGCKVIAQKLQWQQQIDQHCGALE